VLALAALAGCRSDDAPAVDSAPPASTVPGTPPPATPGTPPPAAPPPASTPTARAFAPPAERVALLPLQVRVNRVAAVAGVTPGDPMLADVVARRLDLGAHDFGANVAPDLSWSAQRMSTWTQALFKVCDDPRMRSRYPDWRGANLERFARAAWGRAATTADAEAIAAIAADTGGTADAQWRATCLALLSSAELVLQ
jgi:pyruvate/2-oxoglutarate dehydrogenase complex dihydrolipoamide acyltransferase (E2) component